jgi:hypothetical protein
VLQKSRPIYRVVILGALAFLLLSCSPTVENSSVSESHVEKSDEIEIMHDPRLTRMAQELTNATNALYESSWDELQAVRLYMQIWLDARSNKILLARNAIPDFDENDIFLEWDDKFWPGWSNFYDVIHNDNNYCIESIYGGTDTQNNSSSIEKIEYVVKQGSCDAYIKSIATQYDIQLQEYKALDQSEVTAKQINKSNSNYLNLLSYQLEFAVNKLYNDPVADELSSLQFMDIWLDASYAGATIKRVVIPEFQQELDEGDKENWPGWSHYFDVIYEGQKFCIANTEALIGDDMTLEQYEASLELPFEFIVKDGECGPYSARWLANSMKSQSEQVSVNESSSKEKTKSKKNNTKTKNNWVPQGFEKWNESLAYRLVSEGLIECENDLCLFIEIYSMKKCDVSVTVNFLNNKNKWVGSVFPPTNSETVIINSRQKGVVMVKVGTALSFFPSAEKIAIGDIDCN